MEVCKTNAERAAHLNEIAAFFDGIPAYAINQHRGLLYAENHPKGCACVGAHLAMFYDIRISMTHSCREVHAHDDGQEELARQLGLHFPNLDAILHESGAPSSPFGVTEWPSRPANVFRRAADYYQARRSD